MGPTIYVWIRLAGVMWPRTDIKSSLCKAITEQTAYDPMAISSFLFFMTLMEGNSYAEARREVRSLLPLSRLHFGISISCRLGIPIFIHSQMFSRFVYTYAWILKRISG